MSLEPKIDAKNEAQRESPLRQAQLFTPPDAAPEIIRPASEFVPIDKIPRPSAVTAEPEVITARHIRLESLPIKGLKTAFIASGILATIAIGWPLMQWLTWAFNLQPLLGVGVLMTFTLLLSLCGAGVVQVIKSQAQVNELIQLQGQAQQLTGHKTFGKAKTYIARLQAFYREKPQGEMLAEVLNNLPDYADDHEILAHIERGFLAPLD
ncbi:MAG TPA: hypothetical protein VIZ65_11855, partial [Cellvibrionaceae bacterium]